MSRRRTAEPGRWSNWAGDQVCVPAAIHRPATRQELADVIGRVAARGRRVKVPGSGHSFTSAAMTAGAMIHVDALDQVLDVDRASGLVRVEAGIVLHDLNLHLDQLGLALPNLGDIDRQTIAGAIATATHGTGARLQNISAQVEAAEVVTADGSIVELDAGDDVLAARVHLGALGAVVAVTLRTVPAFTLHRVDEPRPVDDVLAGFDELADSNDHFEFFVFPYADTALTIRRNRTEGPARPRGRVAEFLHEDVLQNRLGDLLLRLTRAQPGLIPRFTAVASRLMSEGDYVDRSFRVFASHRDIRFTEMEYAIPREHGPEAVRRVLDLIEAERFPVGMPIECRGVAADDALLSPTHQRDSVYVAVHQYRGMVWEPYFQAVEEIMLGYAGRPHWGKRHHLTAERAAALYPRFHDFLAVRDRLDPGRVFENAYTRQVLDLPGVG